MFFSIDEKTIYRLSQQGKQSGYKGGQVHGDSNCRISRVALMRKNAIGQKLALAQRAEGV
jgi:hypothetical protein